MKQLEVAVGREAFVDFEAGRDILSVRGEWLPKDDAFLFAVSPEGWPRKVSISRPLAVQLRVLAETGIHSFQAELDFIKEGLWRVRLQGPIKVAQNRAYIRLSIQARIQFQMSSEATAPLREGLGRNIAPGGLAFETTADLAKGSTISLYFGDDPWRILGTVTAMVIGHKVLAEDRRLYRVFFKDPDVSHQLVNLIIEEINRQSNSSPKRKRTG